MIVYEEITIENFRRHRHANFKFVGGKNNNLNIILANNGIGKSTLFDAFTWCFFDVEDHLKIDPKYLEESESLTNTKLFLELPEGEHITTRVIIFLRNNDKKYKIERTINHYKENNKRITDDKSILKVQEYGSEGTSGWSGPIKAPENLLDQIIPKDLRQFFFFDGEQLREHFQGDTSSFLQEKIEEVSRIRYIKQCIKISEELDDLFNSKIAKLSGNVVLVDLAGKIEVLKKKEAEVIDVLDQLHKRFKKLSEEKEIKEKEIFLFGNIQEKELAKKQYLIIKEKLEQSESNYKTTESKMNSFVLKNFQNLSLKNEILNTQTIIDQAVTNKEAPPPITKDYIERLLNVHKECICGTPLKEGTEQRKIVTDLLDCTEVARSIDFRRGQNFLDECSTSIKEYSETMLKLKATLNDLKDKVSNLRRDLLEEGNKIKNYDSNKVKEMKEELKQKKSDLDSLLSTISSKDDEKHVIQSQLKTKENKFTELTKKDKTLKKITLKKDKLNSIIVNFKELMEKIISKNKKSLITKTEEYFRKTCTSKNFEKIRFKSDDADNYELYIEDNNDPNINLLRTLSAGESQIFAFSFAAALREVTKIQSPFIIDTPLGKIDPFYRDEVLKAFPEIFKETQTILLVTESEYTERVKKEITGLYNSYSYYRIHRKFDDTNVESDKDINIYTEGE